MDNPLLPLKTIWMSKIEIAMRKKMERFGRDADEGMRFYVGPYGFLYKSDGKKDGSFYMGDPDKGAAVLPATPTFKMTLNKVSELVQIFGPTLYHQNPNRQVNPRRQVTLSTDILPLVQQAFPQMQMMLQQLQMMSLQLGAEDAIRAILLQDYTNATPNMLDLKTQSRMAIDEALIKGMGILMPRVYTPPGSNSKVVGSFFHSVDDLVIDPDATSLWTAKWIAVRRAKPKWEVVREFGLDPKDVKGTVESLGSQATVMVSGIDGQMMRASGKSADVVVYWEVYSKCGLGKNLNGGGDSGLLSGSEMPQLVQLSDQLAGDFAYLCLCQDIPYPLNCPPQVLDAQASPQGMQQLQQRFQWPTPFWADGLWPICPISFHQIPNDPWPMSHIAPAMGELKFLNWAYSHLAGKVLVTSRDFIAVDKGATELFREAVRTGGDLTLLEISTAMGKSVHDLVGFIQHPPMQQDIFKVCELVEHLFEQRTGLTELKYGLSSRQYRSAAEAEIKKEQSDVRPEEMQNEVEDAMSMLGRMEAFMATWHLSAQDTQPILGAPASYLWQQFVTPSDPRSILYDLHYRVEAGSVRKPNRSRDAENWTVALQNFMPFFQQLAMQGIVGPYNAMVKEWSRTKDMDGTALMLPLPPPPAAPGAPPQGPSQAAAA